MKKAYEIACQEYMQLFPNKADPRSEFDLDRFLQESGLKTKPTIFFGFHFF